MRRRFALLALVTIAGCSSQRVAATVTTSPPPTLQPIAAALPFQAVTLQEWTLQHQDDLAALISSLDSVSSDATSGNLGAMGDHCVVLLAKVTELQAADYPPENGTTHWPNALKDLSSAAVHCINASRTSVVEGNQTPSIVHDINLVTADIQDATTEILALVP